MEAEFVDVMKVVKSGCEIRSNLLQKLSIYVSIQIDSLTIVTGQCNNTDGSLKIILFGIKLKV